MGIRVLLAALLTLISSVTNSQVKYYVDWDFTGQSFESFVRKAESQYPVRFFYEKSGSET